MSYCRWSSDDFYCDLYCYASDQGYTTHVAGNRIVGKVPHTDWKAFLEHKITAEEFAAQTRAQHEFVMKAERKPIGLPHDGKSFDDPDLASFLLRVLQLKQMGYRVSEDVIHSIIEELNEETLQHAAKKEEDGRSEVP